MYGKMSDAYKIPVREAEGKKKPEDGELNGRIILNEYFESRV
jgi:hypothetical protein